MKTHALVALTVLSLSSFTTQAEQQNEIHRVGAQLNGGSASYKGSSKDGDGVGSLYLYYNYQINTSWALELGINSGSEIDSWECKELRNDRVICDRNDKLLFDLNANKIDLINFVVAAKGQYKITDNSYLYGKLGGQYYDYDIARNSNKLIQETGLGVFAEAGWQYDWNNGFAMNVGLQYMDMGDLDTSSLSAGISYRF
ncbi:hypothetical protein PSECIP111951_04051 [Pseudoalteromonas holothuriae]|uniref:Outer membrane protein beta-barrel domain-containing protein n=1 Tax=Pseudoalteromonas holothuriae TaxID=2963714 RepID=A0A9W4W067_9GAMM|nr:MULTISPECIES: porin family protein [unclassified Pseudoalteromonas]CAH9067038.1 hypothetical protein PSECIP111854_04011 [Pseudoalteromonas sp. CIP111854]CAH9068171.1 hypothetical protein PSECIP111951_04051 [Pseudoalteromonas sp. CIP111951]